MSAAISHEGVRLTVELTCDLCEAQVIHTDTVPVSAVTAYLSAAGWLITSKDVDEPQVTLCPRCAAIGGSQ